MLSREEAALIAREGGVSVSPFGAETAGTNSPDDKLHPRFSVPNAGQGSPPTSPPSSVAPNSDDEFTSNLLQRAARKLGVSYTPRQSGVLPSKPHSVSRESPWSLSMRQSPLDELSRTLEIHTKALGANHPSVIELHTLIGDKELEQGNTAKAEKHFAAAFAAAEQNETAATTDAVKLECSKEIVASLAKIGTFFSAVKKSDVARDAFIRAANMCDVLCGGSGSSIGFVQSEENHEIRRARG